MAATRLLGASYRLVRSVRHAIVTAPVGSVIYMRWVCIREELRREMHLGTP